jgi:hypothetical protein
MLITSPNDILFFSNSYEEATGDLANGFEFLSNAKTRVFYSKDGSFLGGYAVSSTDLNPYLRYYTFLEESEKSQLIKKGYREEDCAEITFILFKDWTSPTQRLGILIQSLLDAKAMKKKYILGGGKVGKFNNRMRRVLSNQIYDGKVLVYGHLKDFKILCQKRRYLYFKMFTALLSELKVLLF